MQLQRHIPAPLVPAYKVVRNRLKLWVGRKSNADIFQDIYINGKWGAASEAQRDVYSGPGSHIDVGAYVTCVLDLIRNKNIASVVEIGCGDFQVASQYVEACQTYLGIDVAEVVISHNNGLFRTDKITFARMDASSERLPKADLCVIRQILQHLSNRQIQAVLDNIDARLILVTERVSADANLRRANMDKAPGADVRAEFGSGVYLNRPPFNEEGSVVLETPLPHSGRTDRLRTLLITRGSERQARIGIAPL